MAEIEINELEKEILTFFLLSEDYRLGLGRSPLKVLGDKHNDELKRIESSFTRLAELGFIHKSSEEFFFNKEERERVRELLNKK